MKIQVRLAEPLWRAAGQRDLEMELADGARVAELLTVLVVQYPRLARDLAAGGALVFVGDEEAAAETQLAGGARVHIVWPVAGG